MDSKSNGSNEYSMQNHLFRGRKKKDKEHSKFLNNYLIILKWLLCLLYLLSQKILEKFEFFPIRCRVQRAKEIFAQCMHEAYGSSNVSGRNEEELLVHRVLSLNRKIKNQDTGQKLKTKAQHHIFPSPFSLYCLMHWNGKG
jgi:uncharacterized Fe-S radical SAM superfamily protein PflX